MAVLCSPRRIRTSDRGKGAVLNAALARLFVMSGFVPDRLTRSRRIGKKVACD